MVISPFKGYLKTFIFKHFNEKHRNCQDKFTEDMALFEASLPAEWFVQ